MFLNNILKSINSLIKMVLKKVNLKVLFLAVFVIVLGIYILYDYSFTNIFNSIFTNIHSDVVGYHLEYTTNHIYADSIDNFKDDLIVIQSQQGFLGIPVDGYDVTDLKTFKEMFFKGYGKLCIFSPDQQIKVNGLIVNNTDLYTVHPNLVDYFFELFGI